MFYTLLIELEEELREKTRENESLIESVETLRIKTGITIHVADFVHPNFYPVNLEQAFVCLTCIVYFDYFHSEQPFLSRHWSAETLCWLWYVVVVVGLISIFMRSNAHALEL